MSELALHRTELFSRLACNPGLARNYLEQLLSQLDTMPRAMCRFLHDNRKRYEAMPPCGRPPGGGMTVARNTGTEATVKSDDVTYGFNKTDSGFSVTDANGKSVVVWGDPHYKNADGSSVDIHGDTVTTLQDGTRIFLKTSNAQGGRETNGNAPTYTKSVAIVRPDGSTIFIDNITGPKALEISTPPYGQMPLDFIREKMNGDFRPEAYLSINSKGQWTDMNGLPLTQQSANAMRDIARSQEPLSAALASGCFANGLYPRSLWNSGGFDPQSLNPAYYEAMAQTQNMFEQALRRQAMSQIAMAGPMGNVMMQILGGQMAGVGAGGLGAGGWLGASMGGACGGSDMTLPMFNMPAILGCPYGGGEQRITEGYAAAVMRDYNAMANGGRRLPLLHVRQLAQSAEDPRLRASAQFIADNYDRLGPQSLWARMDLRELTRQARNGVSQQAMESFVGDAGYGGVHPLSRPYIPPMPDVMEQAFGGDFMRQLPAPVSPPWMLPHVGRYVLVG